MEFENYTCFLILSPDNTFSTFHKIIAFPNTTVPTGTAANCFSKIGFLIRIKKG
jgi:hypothetical protein